MKFIKSSLFGIGLLSISALQGASAQTTTLRFHQMLPPQATIPAAAIKPWAEKVEKESGGKIKVQLFPSMQLGGRPPELFDQAKDGVVDIVWTVLGYTPGRFPKTEAFELPFSSGLAEPASRAFQEFVERNRDGRVQGRQADRRARARARPDPQPAAGDQARGHEGPEDPRRLAHHQHHARAAGRHAGGHAGAAGRRGAVQGRDLAPPPSPGKWCRR